MTIDEAIRTLEDWDWDKHPLALCDEIDALKLGIEALKRVQKMRTYKPSPPGLLLPGETEEEKEVKAYEQADKGCGRGLRETR